MSTRWRSLIALLILLALIAVSWISRLRGPIDLRWDAGTYYVLGTALAQGHGYRLVSEPGEILGVQYPPLLPALIALHQLALGTSEPARVAPWLRLTFFAIFTAYILGSYAFLRARLPLALAFLATAIGVLHLMTHFLSDLCFADLPFALAALAFVGFNASPTGRRHPVLTACLGTAAYLFRTAGLALFLGWIAESLSRKDVRQAAARLLLAAIPVVGWHTYLALVEAGPSYTAPAYAYQRADYMFYNTTYARHLSLRDPMTPELGKASAAEMLDRFIGNLMLMPVSLGEAVSAGKGFWEVWIHSVPGFGGLPSAIAANTGPAVLGALVLGGLVLQLARGQVLIPVTLLAYLAAICLTPWPIQWTRYWMPMTPLVALSLMLCLSAIRGASSGAARLWRLLAHAAVVGVLIALFAVQAITLVTFYLQSHPQVEDVTASGQVVRYRLFYGDVRQELNRGLDWVRQHANRTDIVATSMPHWAYLRTGLKTVMPPFEPDPVKAQALLDSVPVRFVIAYKADRHFPTRYFLPLLQSRPDRWALVYRSPVDALDIYERINR